MREIKVKAWDNFRKRFYTSPKWVEFHIDIEGKLTAKNYEVKGYQQLEIIESSGFYDVDKTEIFEGYIVKFNQLDSNLNIKEYVSKVSLYKGCFGVYIQDTFITLKKIFNGYSKVKVIGNIFENPEILKKYGL